MFPVITWNIFALLFANPFLAGFAFIYFIIFRLFSAASFSIILRYITAALYFVIFVYVAAAASFAGDLLFDAAFCCVVARLIVAVQAPAFVACLIFARMVGRALIHSLSLHLLRLGLNRCILSLRIHCEGQAEHKCPDLKPFFHRRLLGLRDRTVITSP